MSFHPDDRPDPSEQPIRARVPDHVAMGCFSTGVIVMTAQTEFILDFVQNLGRPHQIVARVVMPHGVLPQLVDALGRNIQLYRSRWGELPNPNVPNQIVIQSQLPTHPAGSSGMGSVPPASPAANGPGSSGQQNFAPGNISPGNISPGAIGQGATGGDASQSTSQRPLGSGQSDASAWDGNPSSTSPSTDPASLGGQPPRSTPAPSQPAPGQASAGSQPQSGSPMIRQATAQEIYDDLKVRDELLSGSYANAVMIGHGPHEFSFDFITNFYPHSAVSARVFLAAGQIPRLYESLRGTWDQLRQRMQPPNNPPPLEPPPPGWLG